MRVGILAGIVCLCSWSLLHLSHHEDRPSAPGENETARAVASHQHEPAASSSQTVTAMKPLCQDASCTTDVQAPEQACVFDEMIDALQGSLKAIQEIPAYEAVLETQALTRGRLNSTEWMDIKLRHQPFSVYLNWHVDGKEAIYVEGAHDDRLIVRPTRGLAALRGVWRIRPDSAHAMRTNRYPVTELGIEKLTSMALAFHIARDFSQQGMTCQHTEDRLGERLVDRFDVLFDSDQVNADYALSVLKFDRETGLLVFMENHQWEDGRVGEVLERYVYHNFRVAPHLDDSSFDENNPAYQFAWKSNR